MVRWWVGSLAAVALVAGLVTFEPWRAFTNSTVDESLPASALALGTPASAVTPEAVPVQPEITPLADESARPPGKAAQASPSASPAPVDATTATVKPVVSATPEPEDAPAPEGPSVLAEGRFVTAEHRTSGSARIIRLADGSRFLRLDDLDTSDGPDLDVWLSSAPSGGSWGSYDDGTHVALGALKANRGNQNYPIPDGADLAEMRSVVVWCDRFNVAFGTAPISLGSSR